MLYELKLDFDSKRKPVSLGKFLARRLEFISKYTGIKVHDVVVDESRHGYHVTVIIDTTADLDERDITFLQLCLGSDWRREVFNWMRSRAKKRAPHWNILFHVKMTDNLFFKGETERAKKIKESVLAGIKYGIS